MHPDPALPCDLRDLGPGEHLVVWSLRAFAAGRLDSPIVVRAWHDACAGLGEPARNALTIFAQQLALQGRRPVVLAPASSFAMTRDEQLLLAIFGAAQRDDEARCQAHLAWLLRRPAPELFVAAAQGVAHALASRGHDLRCVSCPEPEVRPQEPGLAAAVG